MVTDHTDCKEHYYESINTTQEYCHNFSLQIGSPDTNIIQIGMKKYQVYA